MLLLFNGGIYVCFLSQVIEQAWTSLLLTTKYGKLQLTIAKMYLFLELLFVLVNSLVLLVLGTHFWLSG